MNRKSISQRADILKLLVEGTSMRAASRICDCSINTVSSLLVEVGSACAMYQYERLTNLPCKTVEIDEIWSYVYSKNKNVPEGMEDKAGTAWTWIAVCADTKLVPCWLTGDRNLESANLFIKDLSTRFSNRIQLVSDGFPAYRDAVESAFGADVDFAQLVKMYDKNQRYIGAIRSIQKGSPDVKKITTAHVERQNLTLRMSVKRFARKTNAFSKKIENHCHALSLHFMYYNFVRIHSTLKVTPAMAAGVTNRLWSIEDIIRIAD